MQTCLTAVVKQLHGRTVRRAIKSRSQTNRENQNSIDADVSDFRSQTNQLSDIVSATPNQNACLPPPFKWELECSLRLSQHSLFLDKQQKEKRNFDRNLRPVSSVSFAVRMHACAVCAPHRSLGAYSHNFEAIYVISG